MPEETQHSPNENIIPSEEKDTTAEVAEQKSRIVSPNVIKSSKIWLILLLVMMLFAIGCAATLLYLQISEYNFYMAEPCVWAGKGSGSSTFTPQPLPSTITPLSPSTPTSTSYSSSPTPSTPPAIASISTDISSTTSTATSAGTAEQSVSTPVATATSTQKSPSDRDSSTNATASNVSDLLSILGGVGNK